MDLTGTALTISSTLSDLGRGVENGEMTVGGRDQHFYIEHPAKTRAGDVIQPRQIQHHHHAIATDH